ncbi:MAG: DUF4367 domain-containing protein [Lachnospiraceae bacterium]
MIRKVKSRFEEWRLRQKLKKLMREEPEKLNIAEIEGIVARLEKLGGEKISRKEPQSLSEFEESYCEWRANTQKPGLRKIYMMWGRIAAVLIVSFFVFLLIKEKPIADDKHDFWDQILVDEDILQLVEFTKEYPEDAEGQVDFTDSIILEKADSNRVYTEFEELPDWMTKALPAEGPAGYSLQEVEVFNQNSFMARYENANGEEGSMSIWIIQHLYSGNLWGSKYIEGKWDSLHTIEGIDYYLYETEEKKRIVAFLDNVEYTFEFDCEKEEIEKILKNLK